MDFPPSGPLPAKLHDGLASCSEVDLTVATHGRTNTRDYNGWVGRFSSDLAWRPCCVICALSPQMWPYTRRRHLTARS